MSVCVCICVCCVYTVYTVTMVIDNVCNDINNYNQIILLVSMPINAYTSIFFPYKLISSIVSVIIMCVNSVPPDPTSYDNG